MKMNSKSLNAVPITQVDLREKMSGAKALIRSAKWEITPTVHKNDPNYHQKMLRKQEVEVSIRGLIEGINVEDDLLNERQNHIIRTIREALQLALHVSGDYGKRAGVPTVIPKGATPLQKTEIKEKEQTAAVIALFVMCRYIMWNLTTDIGNNSFLATVNPEFTDLDLSGVNQSLICGTFFLGRSLEKEMQEDDAKLIAIVYKYAERLQRDMIDRTVSLKHGVPFTDISYQLEGTEFTISGFDTMLSNGERIQVSEVYPDQVIGNSNAVDGTEDGMRKLFLYDPIARENPIGAFGGFQTVRLYSGSPGNGKTLVLSVARTLGRDYAEESGLPYRDLVVPNLVSKMQGESSDLAIEFLRKLFDPNTINLGIGDEFEAVLPDHGGEHISEGDKKVAVEFLKMFSGVSSVELYNKLFLAATNYPESVDPAFMSRIKVRYHVVGAETIDDYIRFIILNLKKVNKQHPGLINLKKVDWDRDLRGSRIPNSSVINVNPLATVQDIYDQAIGMYDPDDIRFFAHFFYMMKLREVKFSLRDCANIIDAVKAKIAGFEVPMELIKASGEYQSGSIENKRGLISEIAFGHVKKSGIDVAALLAQNALEYSGEALRMAETKRERDAETMAEQMVVKELALRKFKHKMGQSS